MANANPSSEVFPLGFSGQRWSELSAVKIKRSLEGVWSIHCWLLICCCELPGKGFLVRLGRKNLTAEFSISATKAQSKSTAAALRMTSVCMTGRKTRSEQKKGLDLLGSFLATRGLIWAAHYLQMLKQLLPTELA